MSDSDGVGASGSRTLSRGLKVLQSLGTKSAGATVAELAAATDLDRAVLYRLLQTLESEGFVVRDPQTRRFHLGMSVVELGIRASRSLQVRRLALPGMRALMEQSREAVCLSVRDRSETVVVDRVEPRGLSVRVGYHVGLRHSLRMGAHGRAVLAFLDPDERASIASGQEAELEAARSRGFATCCDEIERGSTAVAAPVIGAAGQPVASVGIVAPTLRLRDASALGPRVRALTLEVSRRLSQPTAPDSSRQATAKVPQAAG